MAILASFAVDVEVLSESREFIWHRATPDGGYDLDPVVALFVAQDVDPDAGPVGVDDLSSEDSHLNGIDTSTFDGHQITSHREARSVIVVSDLVQREDIHDFRIGHVGLHVGGC